MTAIEHTENPGRKTFAFYWSFKDAIRDMPDADKLAVYEAITDFAFFGVDPDGLSPVGRLAWKLIRPQLEASIRRYDACRNNGLKGAEYGKNGGAPKGNQNARKQPQRITPEDNPKNNPLNHNVNDNANVNVNVNEKGVIGGEVATKRRAFVAPSLEMVKDYFLTIKGTNTDSECFYDHFEANGWRISGKSPMKDWKAAARNWMRRKSEFNTTTPKQTTYEPQKQISYNRPVPVEGLPESPELEKAVLGALILDSDQLSDVAEIVEIQAFSDVNNGKIYSTMLSMLERGDKIDLYTLADRPELKGREMTRYLVELTNAVGSGVNILDHARQLANTEIRRRLCLFGHELAARAVSDPDGVVDWATTEITEIADRAVRSDDITPLSDVVRATLDDLERRQQARQAGECIGIPTGLQRLDALTGGWRGGQLVVLAGRPGMGKSAAMLHFARTAAVAGVSVCVFSLEMPDTQLAGRMLVGGSGVNSGSFRTGDIGADSWRRLEQAAADLSALPVYLNDRANITMGAIRSQCKATARRGRCGMVIIDYLQLLDTASRNTNSTREREIAAASRSAKLLAKELDVPVILLSQLSRKVEDRLDKRPLLSDLRESGAIEQDADMVLFLDRPAMYGAERDRRGTIRDHSGRGRRAAAYRQEPGGGDGVRDFPAQRKYYTDCGL